MLTYYVQNVDEEKNYTIDFSDVLGTDTIDTADVTVTADASSPASPQMTAGTPSVSGNNVIVELSGGSPNETYSVITTIVTDGGQTFTAAITVLVTEAPWLVELVLMLRLMINDMADPPTYSDTRLGQLIVMAARYVMNEVEVGTYRINVKDLVISPDPTAEDSRNEGFINLIILKAACLADFATFRVKAQLEGVKATLGPANLQVSGNIGGFKTLIEKGPCAAYEEFRFRYALGQFRGKAIMTPFISNHYDPTIARSGYCRVGTMFS